MDKRLKIAIWVLAVIALILIIWYISGIFADIKVASGP